MYKPDVAKAAAQHERFLRLLKELFGTAYETYFLAPDKEGSNMSNIDRHFDAVYRAMSKESVAAAPIINRWVDKGRAVFSGSIG